MALPITVPYVFGNVTSSIPLSNLDSDFATIYAAVNGIGNGTVALANVVITGGTISNVSETATSYVATKVISTSSNVGAYSYGTLSYSDVNLFESFIASANTYVQNVLQNTNSGTAASVDYVVSNNLGTATTYYGDYGMNGSGWTGTAGTNSFNAPNMVYVTSTTADLLIGTTTSNAVRFAVNGGADSAYISTAGVFTIVNDASISGLTVGKGGGSVSTNTALGAGGVLGSNTTGSYNTALGLGAASSATGSYLTAIGINAGNANTDTSGGVFIGFNAGILNTSGANNTAVGTYSLATNTTGGSNSAFGRETLKLTTTGSYNTAVGHQSLFSNTTGANNTAIGYQAGYSLTTSTQNAFFGYQSGYSQTTNNQSAFFGAYSGQNTTGQYNTFIGDSAGYLVTTGSKNTILGKFSGNNGGLNITTSSNYIVLSDGDGNPRAFWAGGAMVLPAYNGGYSFANSDTGFFNDGFYGQGLRFGNTYGAGKAYSQFTYNGTVIGQISASTTTSVAYQTTSDYRLKENVAPMVGALDTVAKLKPCTYTWKVDGSDGQGFIAHELQAVIPEAVVGQKDQVNEDGSIKPQGIDTSFLVATLTAAIQELNAKVTALEAKLGA